MTTYTPVCTECFFFLITSRVTPDVIKKKSPCTLEKNINIYVSKKIVKGKNYILVQKAQGMQTIIFFTDHKYLNKKYT